MQGNQRQSKTLNIHSKSGLFRANAHCFSPIIDCLRDYFWCPLERKLIVSGDKALFSSFYSL